MRFSTISVLVATSLALTSALPTPGNSNSNSNTAPSSTNIEYCESRDLINALNCIKLLNDLKLDLDILRKREPAAVPKPKSSSKQPSQANVDYCSSQELLNLANCLDILNDVNVDVSILVKRKDWRDDEWSDKDDGSPTEPEEPEEHEQPEGSGGNGGTSDADDEACQPSDGLLSLLNCADILNDLDLDIDLGKKE